MGDQNVSRSYDQDSLRRFTRQLLQDVRALEYMLRSGQFETGARRIGAEQELFLIDQHHNPAAAIEEVLAASTDDRVVSELAKFNLEFNLDPHTFGGTALSEMEAQLSELMAYVRTLSRSVGSDVVMCGILPTLHLTDLTVDNLTPMPRYYALHEVINRLRGGAGQFQIRGTDELFVRHEGMLMEMCNTSFQTHFQVDPDTFAPYYNMAQMVAGPVMALSANSPLLFGKDLWRETRIALFQQAVDTRSANLYLREMVAARALRLPLDRRVGDGDLQGGHLALPRAPRPRRRRPGPLRGARRGRRAAPEEPDAAQRHGLPLEPRRLRRHQVRGRHREAAPAHREPHHAERARRCRTRSPTRPSGSVS